MGQVGPINLQDESLLSELRSFAENTKMKRLVYGRGTGAYGTFITTSNEVTKYCKAKLFSEIGKKTNIICRFSQLRGNIASNELQRDIRGFAIKFLTEDGNLDLVGNNFPVSFLRNPKFYPELVRCLNFDMKTNKINYDALWHFFAIHPETLHQLTLLYGDRGIPNGYRHMNGYGINTFTNINSLNEKYFVRYHWLSNQKIENLTSEDAQQLSNQNPTYFMNDLMESIENKNYPSWTLCMQVMSIEQAINSHYNPFDATKVWPHGEYPLIEIGKLTLNRLPKDFDQEIEQLGFNVGNLVPGVEPSLDLLLQGRIHTYPIAQHARGATTQVGTSMEQHQQQQQQQQDTEQKKESSGPISMAKRLGEKIEQKFKGATSSLSSTESQERTPSVEENIGINKIHKLEKELMDKWGDQTRTPFDQDDAYKQVRAFYEEVIEASERNRLCLNLAKDLCLASQQTQTSMLKHLNQINKNFGTKIRSLLTSNEIKQVEMAHQRLSEETPTSVHTP